MGLNEELDVHGLEDVIHKVWIDCTKDLLLFEFTDSIPSRYKFLRDDFKIRLALQQPLDDEVCERLRLLSVRVGKEMWFNLLAKFFDWQFISIGSQLLDRFTLQRLLV